MKAEDILAEMLKLVEDPEDLIEKVTMEPLENARGELPTVRKANIPLPKATYSSYANLKALRARHYHMIAVHIAGKSNTEIAAEVGVTMSTVSKTLKSPLAVDLISKAMGTQLDEAISLRSKLDELANGVAISRLEDILIADPDNKTALSAIKTVFEYVQSKAPSRTENITSKITAADLVAMRKRASEVQPENLILEEADYEIQSDKAV